MEDLILELKLVGGLGNQLHGLAAGLAISSVKRVPIVFNAREIPSGSNPHRRLKVHHLNLGIQTLNFDNSRISPFVGYLRLAQRKLRIVGETDKQNQTLRWVDDGSGPTHQIKKIPKDALVEGHFLDFQWADIASQEGMRFLGLNTSLGKSASSLLRKITPNSVAIHARFGDYEKNKESFPILDLNFYRRALSSFNSSSDLWLFTDDFKGAKKFLGREFLSRCNLVPDKGISDIESFFLLSNFKSIITANSTFSTWAAYFAERNHGAQIVTPTPHMFGTWKDQLPRTWERIPISE